MKDVLRAARVAFYGEFGCGNLGNEASLSAAMAWFTAVEPEVRLSAFARNPEYVADVHGIPASPIYGSRATSGWISRLPRAITRGWGKIQDQLRFVREIRCVDLVVLPGMGIFENELGGPAWGLPFTLFGASLMCRVRRVPFALVGVGGSADPRASVRWMNRSTVRRSCFLTFRDQFSADSLRSQGADVDRALIFPDIAFGLRSVRDRQTPVGSWTVGLGLINFYDQANVELGNRIREDYEAALADFAVRLIERGHHIRLLIGDASDDEIAQRLFSTLSGRLGSRDVENSVQYSLVTDHRDLADQIDGLDVVVASRYHNLIFALKSGCPTISVSYAPKCTELLVEAGFAQFSQPIESVSVEVLDDQFAELEQDYAAAAAGAAAYARAAADATVSHRDYFLSEMTERFRWRRDLEWTVRQP